MSKLTLNHVANLQSETTALQTMNDNFDAIVTALDEFLSRDGLSPNFMEASLDMNSNRLINLPAPLTNSEPLRLGDVGGITPADIQNAGTYAANAAASAQQAATSAQQAASYVGAATNAPMWTTARTISVYGDISGTSPAWDGSSNLSFTGITINTGAVTSDKLASGAAVTNLGFTPINKAGDTITGDLILSYAVTSVQANSVGFRGVPVNNQDADYTFAADDVGKMVRHTDTTNRTYTLSLGAYPVGSAIAVRNVGTGTVTLARAAGVSLRKVGSSTDANVTVNQWGTCTLVQEDTNVWLVMGTGIA